MRARHGTVASLIVLAIGGAGCRAPEPEAAPTEAAWFVEITEEVGLDFMHESGRDGSFYMPEIIGSGGALFDYDGDGDLDIYLVQSGPHPARAGSDRARRMPTVCLYRQERRRPIRPM